jgi:hypothetical protein
VAKVEAEVVAERSEAPKYPPFFWEGLPPEAEVKVVDEPEDVAERSEAEAEREEVVQERLRLVFPEQAKAEARRRAAEGWAEREAPRAPAGAGPLALTYPRGLRGNAMRYVWDTALLPDRWLALSAALSALAKGTDRLVLGPEDCVTVLWIMLVAETGAGKQHGLNCILALLRAMGLEKSYAASGLGSRQGIEETLMGNTTIAGNESPLALMDELGSKLSLWLSKGSPGNVAEIPGLLCELWGLSARAPWKGSKTLGKEMRIVEGPAFAIYGVSTLEKLIKALTKDLVDNGFLNRFLFFDVDGVQRRR